MAKNLTLQEVMDDPTASHWLKWAISTAVTRDPVDAVNDAEWLAEWLRGRLEEIQEGGW